jgi:predicted kinase
MVRGCLVAPWQTSRVLIVVAGLPGSGKSTLAVDLGRALNCAVLGVDQAEAAMWRAGVSRSGPTHHAAYLVVAALAAEQVALGHDVIVDAVNGPEPARAQWRDLADTAVDVFARTGNLDALAAAELIQP